MIPYGRQSINDDDIEAVVTALKGEFLTTGPLVEKFEQAIERVVGAPCVVVSSGTAALHCAYAAIGLESGDEIICPPLTFIATQATAALMGAKIVFADIQPDTGNIDPKAVEAAITPLTKAIVAVDYAGHPAELDELREIANKNGVYLIEDAAHALGSTYKNRPVGSIADITTFSFFPTKNITTAEGGAIASTNPDLLRRARLFGRQGLLRNPIDFKIQSEGIWHQEVHEFGLNYRLPDVLSALGISQISRLYDFKLRRSQIFEKYTSELMACSQLKIPVQRPYVDSNWHLYPLRVPAKFRRALFDRLRKREIGVQVNYLPAHLHPVFTKHGYKKGNYPIAENFYEEEISIPMHINITDIQVSDIAQQIIKQLEDLLN
jgi:dTDP-4-amino-4,6-dideoxygalactose transaminase